MMQAETVRAGSRAVATLVCPAAAAGLDAYGDALRVCSECPTKLRRSNQGARCGVCERRASGMALAAKDRAAVRRDSSRKVASVVLAANGGAAMTPRKVASVAAAQRRFFGKSGQKVSEMAAGPRRSSRPVVNDLDPLPPPKLCLQGCGQPRHGGRCKGPERFAATTIRVRGEKIVPAEDGADYFVSPRAREYRPGLRQAVAQIPPGFEYPDPADASCIVPLAEVPGPARGGRPRNPMAAARIERYWSQVQGLAAGAALLVTCADSSEARDVARRMRTRARLAESKGATLRPLLMVRRVGMDCWFWRTSCGPRPRTSRGEDMGNAASAVMA